MKELIDDFIASEEVLRGRPYPYMIHHLMERSGILNVKEVAKIGDTKSDILEGINAGLSQNIGVLSGADPRELLEEAGASNILENIMELRIREDN